HGAGEVLLVVPRVDADLADARLEPHARHRVLALARGIGPPLCIELLGVDRRCGWLAALKHPQVFERLRLGHRGQPPTFLPLSALTSRSSGFCASCGCLSAA